MEKTAPPVQTTSQFILIKHSRFGSNHGTSSIHQQHQTIPHHQAIASTSILAEIARELTKIHPIKLEPSPTPPKIHLGHTLPVRKQLLRLHHPPTTPNDSSPPGSCPHFNSCGNHLRTRKDTSNQARALSHTSQNTHWSNINISEEITAPPPSTVNSKQSFTIKLLPTLQLSRKLLENLQRYTQSSASLPPHLPQFTSIEHCHFGSNHGAAAATQRYTTVLHNQAIDSTPIFCGNCSRNHEDSANQARALPHTNQNSPRSHIAILETITVPPPSTDNTKWSLTTRLLPALQFLQKLLENLQRYIQSSEGTTCTFQNHTTRGCTHKKLS